MKKLILISAVFISQILLAQTAPNCNLQNDPNQARNQNCETINKLGECKEAAPVDENAMRNRLLNMFKISEDPKMLERLGRNWALETKNNPWITKMYAERSQYENQEKLKPTPILDWMSNPQYQSGAKSKDEYREAIIKKYTEYAKKMDCTPTFYASDHYMEYHPTVKGFDAKNMGRDEREARIAQMKTEMAKPENVKALKDRMDKVNAESPEKLYICSDKPLIEARYKAAVAYEPCAGNFKKNFDNNKYQVSDGELAKLLQAKDASELSACIKDRISKGAKLHHISIDSSASSLNNTGNAAERFCKKGFLGLSEARAETARSKVVPGLFAQAGVSDFDITKVKVQVNAGGANGDGTSGPCVYDMKNGKEVLKPYYNTKAGQAELDENRYVKVQVTFEESSAKIDDKIPHYQPSYNCKKINFKCEG